MFKTNISRLVVKYGLWSVVALLSAFHSTAASVNEDPVYKEAIAKFEQNEWQAAHRLFKQLQESYPDNPIILNNLAVVAVQLNQPELAVRLLEHAILSHPTLSVSYKNLQSLYNYQAAQEYKKALSLDSLKLTAPKLNLIGTEQAAGDDRTAAELVLSQETIEKPLVEEAQPAPSGRDKEQLAASLKHWAEAWSRQDLDAYFNSYVTDYRPRSGTAHERWRKLREDRIVKPQFINIRISDLSIDKQDADNAVLIFKQHYQSNLLKSAVIKELTFYRTEAGWKIKSERVVNPS